MSIFSRLHAANSALLFRIGKAPRAAQLRGELFLS